MTKSDARPARIGREDWISAALVLLQREGIAGVRVEPLALRLKVTKGSFYWHFKDRAALHTAMIDHWRAITTREVIERFDRTGGDARVKLRRLIALATGAVAPVALDTAMRAWARQDPAVAAAVAATDNERVAFISALLCEMGIKPGVADLRARIVYLAAVGSYFSQAGARRGLWREIETLIS
jgi:AcrR family transcriptional regulator